ncbi:MAG TPA: ATP-binding protein [Acidobacteriota bacterium]|nr:ATP-binding protein [Acidobacteriota bacterium]
MQQRRGRQQQSTSSTIEWKPGHRSRALNLNSVMHSKRMPWIRRFFRRFQLPSEPGAKLLLALGLLLAAVNVVGIWGIVYSGREATQQLLNDLELQAVAAARSVEAALASTRADFVFLVESPPISSLRATFAEPDPVARRWRRLDVDSTLLLFMASHPEVERIVLFLDGSPTMAASRREGAPVLVPPPEPPVEDPSEGRWIRGSWQPGRPETGVRIEGWLSLDALLAIAAPGRRFELLRGEETSGVEVSRDGETLKVEVPVRDPDWNPPVDWRLVVTEQRTGLLESISQLTTRYRTTLAVNVVMLLLAAVLGVIAIRQVRHGIALELENRQQAQIRELERQMLHSERLATVGRLAASMAHEINNPLEGMANYLLLLEDELKSAGAENCLVYVDKVREGLRRTAGVTRRALTFADPGRKPNSPVVVEDVLAETLEFVRGSRLFKQVTVTVGKTDRRHVILGNPVTLGQAFLNLLINAAELQGGNGSIEISFAEQDGGVTVSIADQGPGISPELMPKIFEPFYSGRGSSGLGLAICRTIVQNHDGRIEAGNRPGGGAVFSVWIPLYRPQEDQTGIPQAQAVEPRSDPKTVHSG